MVYGLFDPVTRKLRYVGMTCYPTQRRRYHTVRIKRRAKTAVDKWSNEMIAAGTPPIFEAFADLKHVGRYFENNCQISHFNTTLRVIESHIIERALFAGCDLLNYQNAKAVS